MPEIHAIALKTAVKWLGTLTNSLLHQRKKKKIKLILTPRLILTHKLFKVQRGYFTYKTKMDCAQKKQLF